MSFKDNWLKEDKKCPTCGQVTEVARGINKQNLKRLAFSKPTMQDWLTLVMIVGVLLMAWRYNTETSQARYVLNNLDEVCMQFKGLEAISSSDPFNKSLLGPGEIFDTYPTVLNNSLNSNLTVE